MVILNLKRLSALKILKSYEKRKRTLCTEFFGDQEQKLETFKLYPGFYRSETDFFENK